MAAAGHASSDKEERRDCMMQMEDFLLVLRRGIAATVEETRQSGKTCLQMAGRAYYPLKEAALLGQASAGAAAAAIRARRSCARRAAALRPSGTGCDAAAGTSPVLRRSMASASGVACRGPAA
eukprot:CAMPEP_0171249418 /NCGR_PEP_ID=MMETSP0790-20130122/49531_1 /TAXON_ID=2925 /ORGANISM="Alexandrium catenella, Strain OF101" /LENGTH=122 /DNA_ID=CAMNT_0011716919 /DNA_START=67 /DNA_END=432 /DNA_ORIENTATION=+